MINSKLESYLVPISIVVAGLIIGASLLFLGQNGPVNTESLPSGPPAAADQFQKVKLTEEIDASQDPVLGNPEAVLLMVEFSDFQCPFCRRHHEQTFPELKAKYFDTGKVKLVFKDFPLPIHENAQAAAEAGQCAFEQGKFWEYQDKLFDNQEALAKDGLKKYAGELGLNQAQFDVCLDSGKFRQRVKDDVALGQKLGVNGTPGFLVGDRLIEGAYPFSAFEAAIEEQLK